jgi:hypothetical protein
VPFDFPSPGSGQAAQGDIMKNEKIKVPFDFAQGDIMKNEK